MLFYQKYAPSSLEHFAGNKEAVSRAKQWALGFTLGTPGKPLLLYGPPGCGKSALAAALAAQMEWNVVSVQLPSPEQKDKWDSNLASAFSNSSLFGASNLVLVEDVDTWAASKARSAITSLLAHLASPRLPVLLTASDAYDRSLSSLRTHCELLPMKAVNSADITSVLSRITKSEKLAVSEDEIRAIASNANGDLRAAICDLQARNPSASRERSKALFEQVRTAMRAPTLAATRRLQVSLSERDTLKLYICQNLPLERPDPASLAAALGRLSRADVFDGRIRTRQYWGYLRYSSDLMLWGVASTRPPAAPAFVPYAFPSYIQRMGATKAKRSLRKALSAKVAVRVHATTRRAADFLPLLQAQGQAGEPAAQQLSAYYSFDEDELAGLLERAPAAKPKKSAAPKAKAPAARTARKKKAA
ncbi:Replication factor C large subunit [uncultured archaeon]|nr:Replication factor C large subunit [uncultured archaeon]